MGASTVAATHAPEGWRSRQNPLWLIIAVSTWLALVANVPLWHKLGELAFFDQFKGWLFVAAMGLMIAAAMTAVFSLLAWRWTLKPALCMLLAVAALGAYFMSTYSVVIDQTMLVNALQTDPREVRDLLSLKLLAWVAGLALMPIFFVWRWPVQYGRWARRGLNNLLQTFGALVLLTVVALASFSPLASTMRNHKEVRYLINPLNSLYAGGLLAAKPFRRDDSVLEAIGTDASLWPQHAGAKPPLLVLVLGETGRSGNFGLNGYERDTTPELAKQNVASMRNAWSCGTSTAASVPCMFSNLRREGFDSRKANAEDLLDVVQHAGMAVLWLDNQSGCKGVCDRVPNVSTTALADPELCRDGECLDGIMLKGLDERIAALPAERRAKGIVVVMHQMGSHGPAYYLRSPKAFKRYLPECRSNDLQSCTREELVNAYDNTIAYTDHFLSSTIDWLKTRSSTNDTAMLYIADHGESLGENNVYLHGMPYMIAPDVQKHVPWVTWLSPAFSARSGISTACLAAQADKSVSHDNYFHSVLGLLGIDTKVYRDDMDIYAPCAIDSLALGSSVVPAAAVPVLAPTPRAIARLKAPGRNS
jgi:lipid A ethanolaminephosphotransferase